MGEISMKFKDFEYKRIELADVERDFGTLIEELKAAKEQAEIKEIKESTEKIDLDLTDDILGELNDIAGEDALETLDEVIAPVENEEEKTLTTKKARGLESLMTSDYIPTAERELEEAKEAEKAEQKQAPRKKKEEKVEEKPETKVTPSNYMPVYTDEELEALDAEEEEVDNYDDDVDYDEFDKYYE